MVFNILKILFLQFFLCEVFSQYQQPVPQYVSYGSPTVLQYGPPTSQNYPNNPPLQQLPLRDASRPFLGQGPPPSIPNLTPLPPILPNLSLPKVLPPAGGLPSLTAPVSCPSSSKPPKLCSCLESDVVNNLAIALQYLIAGHILNLSDADDLPVPPPCTSNVPVREPLRQSINSIPLSYTPSLSLPSTIGPGLQVVQQKVYQIPASEPIISMQFPQIISSKPVSYYTVNPSAGFTQSATPTTTNSCPFNASPVLPNANFIGSSSYVDTNVISNFGNPYGPTAPISPRTSSSLMSPYEALAPNSPFSDSFMSSPYGSASSRISKRDFQSPYTAILEADKDKELFSMDFF